MWQCTYTYANGRGEGWSTAHSVLGQSSVHISPLPAINNTHKRGENEKVVHIKIQQLLHHTSGRTLLSTPKTDRKEEIVLVCFALFCFVLFLRQGIYLQRSGKPLISGRAFHKESQRLLSWAILGILHIDASRCAHLVALGVHVAFSFGLRVCVVLLC